MTEFIPYVVLIIGGWMFILSFNRCMYCKNKNELFIYQIFLVLVMIGLIEFAEKQEMTRSLIIFLTIVFVDKFRMFARSERE
ncbi:hypothetical protein BU107_13770 [Staphylococcus xylosus]|uniref:hypothetical protein n=1 Tax=Staphylococcus xylosus TaxID=1288 RepID=UPI000E69CF18|nr:hypothetical protein [Staphylococcus xylosus]RIM84239.1 hypothetical protein BU107_13770 [Staphylococcus xylosus]